MGDKGMTFSSSDAARGAGISVRQLYYWERIGILSPGRQVSGSREFRRYSEEDVVLLRKVKGLIDEGFTLRSAMRRVKAERKGVEGR